MGTNSDLLVGPGESVGTADAAQGWGKDGNYLPTARKEWGNGEGEREREGERKREREREREREIDRERREGGGRERGRERAQGKVNTKFGKSDILNCCLHSLLSSNEFQLIGGIRS